MWIGRGNRSTRAKCAPVPLCPPQTPHDLVRARTRVAAVGSLRLTAWAMAVPHFGRWSPHWVHLALRPGWLWGWGSRIFRHSAHRWRQGCQPYVPAAFYFQEDSWYSFLLEAESTPRDIVRLEELGKLKKSTSFVARTGDRACSILPQPTTLRRALLCMEALKVARGWGLHVVDIATSYGLDDRGVGVRVPVGSRIFSSPNRPDRL
jgi:hypothetical protein